MLNLDWCGRAWLPNQTIADHWDCGQKSQELADRDKNDKVPTRPSTLPPQPQNIPWICNKLKVLRVNNDVWWTCCPAKSAFVVCLLFLTQHIFEREKETHGNALRFEMDSLPQCRVNVKNYSSKPLYKAVVLYKLLRVQPQDVTLCLAGSVWTLHIFKTL